jgi:hypothetical protein
MTEKNISNSFHQNECLEFAIGSPKSALLEAPLIHRRGISYRKSRARWLGLFLQCSLNIGQRFCFDNPQALQFYLTSEPIALSSTQYNFLYSIYSFPNIILPIFAGIYFKNLYLNWTILLKKINFL